MHLKKVPLGRLYDETGMHPEFLRRVFNGAPTSEQTICKLAKFLGVPPWKAYKQLLEVRESNQQPQKEEATA